MTNDSDTTTDDVLDAPLVIAELIHVDDDAQEDQDSTRALAIRHVLERQLVAGQDLSIQLVDAATDVTVAVVHAPAAVVDEVRGGATLPTAVTRSGVAVRDAVTTAGERVRSAVGGYVSNQAALPNAVVFGAADVAESVVRAQGVVTASALHAGFSLATVAARGGDVRNAIGRERTDFNATTATARDRIGESVARVREEIRSAVRDDDLVEVFT